MHADISKHKMKKSIWWVVVTDYPLTLDAAKELQNKDYPVAGYGFWEFFTEPKNGGYLSTWSCYDSCD